MNALSCRVSGVRRAVAGIAAALIAAVAFAPAPAMATMDPADPVVHGAPFVGSTLTLEIDPDSYRTCGKAAGPDYHIYWTRDGEHAEDHWEWGNYTHTEGHRGNTSAA